MHAYIDVMMHACIDVHTDAFDDPSHLLHYPLCILQRSGEHGLHALRIRLLRMRPAPCKAQRQVATLPLNFLLLSSHVFGQNHAATPIAKACCCSPELILEVGLVVRLRLPAHHNTVVAQGFRSIQIVDVLLGKLLSLLVEGAVSRYRRHEPRILRELHRLVLEHARANAKVCCTVELCKVNTCAKAREHESRRRPSQHEQQTVLQHVQLSCNKSFERSNFG